MNKQKHTEPLHEMWGEHISLKQLFLAILISVFCIVIALVLAPKTKESRLVYGLIAVIISFVINIMWIKPKRHIEVWIF